MRFARTIGPQPVSIWRWTQKILRPDAGSNAPYFFYGVRPEVWGATTIPAPRTSGATTRTISLPPRPFRPDTTCPMKRRLKPPLRCASSLPPNKSDGRRRRHVEKAAHDVPEQMTIDRNRHRMRGIRQNEQLLVAMRKLPVKIDQIFHCCDAVIFAAHEQDWRVNFLRVDDGEIGDHVEVCPGRHLIAELQFNIGKDFPHGRIGRAGFVAREDALDHGAVAQSHIV